LGVVRDPCDPECVDHPQNNEKAAHATTDIHVICDVVCTALGVSGGLQGVAARKSKRCGVKWATDRMLRLSVLSNPDEGNFLERG
jgi:hypothetical protein